MKPRILIIDDDDLVCISLKKALTRLDNDVDICMEGEKALHAIKTYEPDLILLDIYLTTHNGLEILNLIKNEGIDSPVIMITGYADVNIAVSAIKGGALDFLLKPIDMQQLQLVIEKAMENFKLKDQVNKLNTLLEDDYLSKDFFGKSRKIQKLVNSVEKLAQSSDTTILIDGESGTGKEMFARFIHQRSPRSQKAFIQINCSAIPKELAESEFFGHEKGAFTGASQKTKLGKFELADGGTILLDEIGELTLDLQVKLLRVLQEKKFYRVGGEREIKVDVRVLAATNRDLEVEVAKGNFREDLFYRINVANVYVPSLKERTEDLPYLAYSFLVEFAQKFNKNVTNIDDKFIEILKSHEWKGNIRELRNIMERVMLLNDEETLKDYHLSFLVEKIESNETQSGRFNLEIPPNGIKMEIVLKDLILKTLTITDGNQVKAAKILGLSRSKLRYRMEQFDIEVVKNIR
ncbi:MAG: sigma-54 dependent transcriptional regulator [Melioribacteraceae bacterium]|jgi:two-component system response regulator AtoC|nr:sigma-54 dependent transcriptional regulator [Melioribacteraceae bacterium]